MQCADCGVEAGPRRKLCATHRHARRILSGRRSEAKRPNKHRDWYRKKRQARLQSCPPACDICGVSFGTTTATRPCWDHDHQTGQFRAWLCHRCNVSLGLMDDSPERLRAAADYLERHRG